MSRIKSSNSPRPNIWNAPSPYGTYEGEHGCPDSWKMAFEQAIYSREKALGILTDSNQTTHDILGVCVNATADEIKLAYKKLVLIHHPDKGGDRNEFEKIHAAYSLLIKR